VISTATFPYANKCASCYLYCYLPVTAQESSDHIVVEEHSEKSYPFETKSESLKSYMLHLQVMIRSGSSYHTRKVLVLLPQKSLKANVHQQHLLAVIVIERVCVSSSASSSSFLPSFSET